ncbi:MAG: CpaF family protein [Lachnospiraceae bacterium]|nr:CpaF family protein [Lachnospiraceae bacterium]SFT51862.1 pilus assembly protein CpaF [Lachnospiraceae bacterium XBD2001]MBQ1607492.1 CpaF family protein [Lachnospiraceae bacterium]MBQ1721616.1 CpaF family protein [Lachnospiraceae bacterium]MBQ2466247.1 CpaF family protein [Lachnospiraceae bacterium]
MSHILHDDCEWIRQQVLSRMDLSREVEDEEITALIQEEIIAYSKSHPLTIAQRMELERDVFNSLRKLDVLQDLLEEEDITEIMINGPDDIFVERYGELQRVDKHFSSEEKLADVIQQIVSATNRTVNTSSPIVDTRLSDGSRVNIVLSPIAIDHSILSIRKFPKHPINMDRLLALGSLSPEVAEFLGILVRARYNIFLSGGTGSGKTTFLNALTEFIPPSERVITIEDSAELQLIGIENLVRMEARNANLEGKLEVPIRDLVKTSLRLRPDRIIIGECRGAETLDMLQANNTGHSGTFSTGHANSCVDMLSRMETMVLMAMNLPLVAVRQMIASGIDIIIQLGRLPDRSRKMLEIAEVEGIVDGEIRLHTLYEYQREGGQSTWVKKGNLIHREKLLQVYGEEAPC